MSGFQHYLVLLAPEVPEGLGKLSASSWAPPVCPAPTALLALSQLGNQFTPGDPVLSPPAGHCQTRASTSWWLDQPLPLPASSRTFVEVEQQYTPPDDFYCWFGTVNPFTFCSQRPPFQGGMLEERDGSKTIKSFNLNNHLKQSL